MDVRSGNSSQKLKGLETENHWVPITPVKPGQTSFLPICTEKQEFQPIQASWNGKHICLHLTGCPGPGNCVESDLASCHLEAVTAESQVLGDTFCGYGKFSMGDADQLNKMSFQNLLALAEAGGAAAVENGSLLTAFTTVSSPSVPVSCNQTKPCQFQTIPSSSSQANKGCFLNPRLLNDSDSSTRGIANGFNFFDLNMAPRTVTNASSSSGTTVAQFEPITPDQDTKRSFTKGGLDVHNLCMNDAAKDGQNGVTITLELNEQQNGSQSELVNSQSGAPASELWETDKPGIGTDQNTDLKTPPQKPRRRKHRPKVVIEGQPKKTPTQRNTKPSGPDGIARVKRKYVRKNRASEPGDTPLEAATANLENMSNGSEEKPRSKRKYVRRKGINEAKTTPLQEGDTGAIDVKATRATRRSCRRSLNFDSESHLIGESSNHQPTSDLDAKSRSQVSHGDDQSKPTMNSVDDIVDNMEAGIAYDLAKSMNHLLEDYLSNKERQSPSFSASLKMDQVPDMLMNDNPNKYRGKCQIIFSDTTHDKEANFIESVNSDGQSATRSPSISYCSSITYMNPEKQTRGSKRQQFSTAEESDSCSINVTEAQCNSLQVYLNILPPGEQSEEVIANMDFPAIHKKKRTEKGSKSASSSILPTVPGTDYYGAYDHNSHCPQTFTSESGLCLSATHYDPSSISTKTAAAGGPQEEEQNSKYPPSMGSTDRFTKKRSKVPTRVRDLASLLEICKPLPSSSIKGSAKQTCMEALVADTRTKLTTKKRSKRNLVGASPNTYLNNQVLTNPMGIPAAIMWENMSPIDAVIEQFNRLDIDAESNKFANPEHSALVAYHQQYPAKNALVLYQSDGTIVRFSGSFDHTRKQRPRPKVDLDDETTRVWRLLLEDINSEGIDGTDEQKAKWWRAERKVFRGRAKTFISRMRLVQGDRRFTPWKGSVVDSVVGVFLTQNVSDHLSSSAFISMAARFPLKSSNREPSCEEGITEEPEVLDPDDSIDWHNKMSNQQTTDQDCMILQGSKCDDGEINHRNFFEITSQGTKSTENISFLSDSSEYGLHIYSEAGVGRLDTKYTRMQASFNRVQRELDVISSRSSSVSPQNSVGFIGLASHKTESFSPSCSGAAQTHRDGDSTSFVKLLQMAGTAALHEVYNHGSTERSSNMEKPTKSEDTVCDWQRYQEPGHFNVPQNSILPDKVKENEVSATDQSVMSEESAAAASSENIIALCFEEMQKLLGESITSAEDQETDLDSEVQKLGNKQSTRQDLASPIFPNSERTNSIDKISSPGGNIKESNLSNSHSALETDQGIMSSASKAKRLRNGKDKKHEVDWDILRKQALDNDKRSRRTANNMDSVDWEAVRCAPVEKIAETIKERGMNNMLAERIKDFLNRIVRDHGSIDLEWLRDVPPDKAKEYLLSIRGLGLKSVECVRLLTLHHLAFPVDTNVGRIAVRLGWVPLQPLPESLQLHLLELYPVLESIQKYLWPRLCKLDQGTLYELHYQMITFGKVFCTKNKPNCNSCPMRGECRHFASAFASARLALPAPEEKGIVSATESKEYDTYPAEHISYLQLPEPPANQPLEAWPQVKSSEPIIEEPATPEPPIETCAITEPIVELPASPEPAEPQVQEVDIEDMFLEDAEGIPTIDLNLEELNRNLQNIIQNNVELQGSAMSKALVVLTPEAASIPMPKLKNISRLRTEHRVYELPDTHQLLEGLDKREPDDPCPYLLAIWTPGETINSVQPPERRCIFQESGKLCYEETCFSCNSIREATSQTVRGTLLIPCRTAMRGSFPLNGTYFQVNEVFADHESSLNPVDVPRNWLWNLKRRTVYFGTSIPTIFKGLQSLEIQYCFWRGFVCVRGFDRKIRAPRPLVARLHFPASKMTKTRGRTDET